MAEAIVVVPGEVSRGTLRRIYRTRTPVRLDPAWHGKVIQGADIVARTAQGDPAVYGINTGFGALAKKRIRPEDTEELQRNLILSHCCGVGDPTPPEIVHLMMALKIVSLGRGASGVRLETITTLEKMLLGGKSGGGATGLKLMAVDQSPLALLKALIASIRGQLGDRPVVGVHVEQGDVIRIESERSSVILDGEEFHALKGRPIVLRSTPPVSFLRLAA